MLIYLPVALLNMAVFFGMSLVLFLFLMRILRLSDDSAPEYAVAGIGATACLMDPEMAVDPDAGAFQHILHCHHRCALRGNALVRTNKVLSRR